MFSCPFCNKDSSSFLPFGLDIPVLKEKHVVGGGYRLNAVCPNCGSNDRERLVYLYLRKHKKDIFSNKIKVLHVAPEKKLQEALLTNPAIDYLTADIEPSKAMVQMDITDIQYPDNSFNAIICNHVLEHIVEDKKAMAELYRILRPGGWAILQVPVSLSLSKTYEDFSITSAREREKAFGQSDHVRIYARDYKNRLEEAGFDVHVYNFNQEFGESDLHRYGLVKDEKIYICSKPELNHKFEKMCSLETTEAIQSCQRSSPRVVESPSDQPFYINNRCTENSIINEILSTKSGSKTKTLLINPDTPRLYQFGGASGFPMGLGYIAAVLEKDFDVSIIDIGAEGVSSDQLKERISAIKPKIVGITSDTLSFQRAIDIATLVKRVNKDVTIVIGGAHANAMPDYPLKYDCFDISVYGEGERTAVELWDRIEKGQSYENIKGICFRKNDEIMVNPPREFIENLDELPYPARHLFPMDKYTGDDTLETHPVYSINTSRGCPYSCAFCSNNVAFGRKYRYRSAKNVVDEIESLIHRYAVKGIYFREDLFTANRQRVVDICNEIIKRGLHFNWECESRINTVDEELLQTMKNAGCELIWFVVESGSQRVLDILNKQIKLAQTREVFDLCHKIGIKTGASLIFGIPGETREEMQKTIELAEDLKSKCKWIGFVVFTGFPHSPLYEFVRQNNMVEKEVNHGILIAKTDEFNRTALEAIRQYALNRLDRRNCQHMQKADTTNAQNSRLIAHLIEGQKVLEMGCGTGDLSLEIISLGFDLTGIDTDKAAIQQVIERAKKDNPDKNLQFIQMDPASLQFPDNFFDTTILQIPDDIVRYPEWIKQAVRVTRNGGRIVLSLPDATFKEILTGERSTYAEEIIWHELSAPEKPVGSFFIRKPADDIYNGPLVDILMPTYQGRKYIRRAIQSVVAQTYKNWNLIVVNDGGEDIDDIIREFKDSRIKYIVAEHKGKSHALNVGIRAGKGEYTGYLDDDDIYYPIHLEVLIKAAIEHNRDYLYADWYEVYVDLEDREFRREFEFRLDVEPWMLIRKNYINHKAILHKRALFDKTGLYDEQLDVLIDWDMIRRLAFVCRPLHVWGVTSERICYYDNSLMENRITSIWRKDPEKARKSTQAIINKTSSLSAAPNELYKAVVDSLQNRSYYHQLEFNQLGASMQELRQQIQEKEKAIQDLIQEKEKAITDVEMLIYIRDEKIREFEFKVSDLTNMLSEKDRLLQQIMNGTIMHFMTKFKTLMDKLLPGGTAGNQYYYLFIRGLQIIVNEGLGSFFSKFKRWINSQNKKYNSTYSALTPASNAIAGREIRPVDIIIPVYNQHDWQYELFKKCLTSVLSFSLNVPYRIIIIDDASTDQKLQDYLTYLKSRFSNIMVLRNSVNVGFLPSVNRGLKYSDKDVVILNSDAVVTYDWLAQIQAVAYSNEKIATVTPLSNNATICSVPKICEANQIPSGYNIHEFGTLVAKAARKVGVPYYTIPVGIGYCMYLKREVINKIGVLCTDFGRGYEEEVDLCLRAFEKGYKHVAIPSVFVYHAGTACTDNQLANQLEQKNWELVVKRHPYYPELVSDFVAKNPLFDVQNAISESVDYGRNDPVRIGIDAQLLKRVNWTGSERYIKELITGLVNLDCRGNIAYTAFSADNRLDECYINRERFVRKYAQDTSDILWDPDYYDVDVFHRPFQCYNAIDLLSLVKAKASVISILDLISYHHPDYFVTAAEYENYRKITKLSAEISDRVIAISEHAKHDLVNTLAINPAKVDVIYPAILDTSRFRKIEDLTIKAAFKAKYNLNKDYLLYVATTFPHKNHEVLISAYASLLNEMAYDINTLPDLVLIGPDTHLHRKRILVARASSVKEKVHFIDYVPDVDMPLFYNCASLFVFPSLYEGFGLPILEAMACEVPIIASNATSIPEVAGDAAIFVDCTKPDLLAKEIRSLLLNPELREELIEKGRKRICYFSKKTMVDKTIESYLAALRQTSVGKRYLPDQVLAQLKEIVIKEGVDYYWHSDWRKS